LIALYVKEKVKPSVRCVQVRDSGLTDLLMRKKNLALSAKALAIISVMAVMEESN
jgi:hypothetical protein